jgi:putative membrane protein
MEGPAGVKPMPPVISQKEAVKLVILFHVIGLIGFAIPTTNAIFLKLVPWHLLFMFILLVCSHQHIGQKFVLYIIAIFFLGYLAEWSGINHQWLFGDYGYGKTLGIKLLGVPVITGINWFLLTYSAGVLMQHSRLKNAVFRVLAGAFLLVLLDLLIEPVAIKFDYWQWAGSIPFKNYACWFLASSIMLAIFELFRFKKQSIVAVVFLATQFIFFAFLNFLTW